MVAGVYGIFDQITNECLYIGQSKNIEVRWQGHIKSLERQTHKRKDFIDWFIKHDEDLKYLRFELLEICENEDKIKNKLEIKYFNKYHPLFYGKQPSLNEKWEHSDETKKKISNSVKKLHPNGFRSKRVEKECLGCGKIMILTLSASKRRVCCSKKCLGKIYKKDVDENQIADLYKYGYSLHEISAKYNVSYMIIYKRLKSMNIKMRNQKGTYD